ncbi:MAG: hypothetical protein HW421_3838 [Ignavibacteria bacterium]|nr:hypothetical protein [Ignavibacteria bacterium]
MTNQSKAYIFALIAVLFWSTVATAFKIALSLTNILHIIFISSFVSLIILTAIILYQGKFKQIFSTSRSNLARSAFLGFLVPFGYYLILFKAYSILPAAEALTLNYTWAVAVVLLSIPLLHQKISLKGFLALMLSFFGVILIATRGDVMAMHFHNPAGSALALGSSIVWALYWILNVRDKRDEIIKLFFNFLFGCIFTALIIIFSSGLSFPSTNGLLASIYIGCFEMGFTFIVWLKAMQLTDSTAKIGNLIFLSPFLSMIFIQIFLHETILLSYLIGLLLIIGGIVLQRLTHKG